MGAADHRALPRRPPGRRAGGLPARPRRGWPTTSASSPGPRLQRARAAGSSHARPARSARRPTGREPAVAVGRARRPRRRDRRAWRAARAASGSSRSSARAGSARRRVAIATGRRAGAAGRRLAGPARGRDDAPTTSLDTVIAALDVDRRRGGAARAAPARAGGRSILDNCEHVVDAAAALAVAPARRRARAADPVHEPGRRSTSTARPCSSSRRSRSPTPSSCSRAAPRGAGDAARACTSCAARSTGCRWRSSSPRRAPGRCRSRRSPAASTTASAC